MLESPLKKLWHLSILKREELKVIKLLSKDLKMMKFVIIVEFVNVKVLEFMLKVLEEFR